MSLRVGIGFDAHRCVVGRPLILGGVAVPSAFGLEAHSDGDVLVHAMMDALLGAANLGDKGVLFPPSDPQYKNIRSTILLQRVSSLLASRGYIVQNIDVSVMCEEPKLAPYIPHMKMELSRVMELSIDAISIKATTTERLGFTGRGEGIAAMAAALIDCTNHDR